MKPFPIITEEPTHLLSETGERGPRLDVVLRMFERMLEYEEEVERGERVPCYILKDGVLTQPKPQPQKKIAKSRA